MRKGALLSIVMLAASIACEASASAANAPGLKCPVSGHAARKEHVAEHNGGKVYFCCDDCRKTFAAKTPEFAARANLQLVLSGQFKEVKCPLEGYALNPITTLDVGGVKVLFCCKGCKNVVGLAKSDEQINLVFSDKAFKKGFAKATDDVKK